MKTLLMILLVFPGIAIGQSISVSPVSVTAFSQTPYASEAMLSYKFFDVHLIYVSKKVYKGRAYHRPDLYFGITISPEIDLKYISAEPIIGYYNERVGSYYGSKWNFGFSVYRNIFPHIDIYIRHLSNAGIGELNPGIDWVGIRARL